MVAIPKSTLRSDVAVIAAVRVSLARGPLVEFSVGSRKSLYIRAISPAQAHLLSVMLVVLFALSDGPLIRSRQWWRA